MVVQVIIDVLLFKLAFHTYEALSNKSKIQERNKKKEAGKAYDQDDDLDLVSNMSDESTMTMGGPPEIRDRKIERYDEKLDVELNRYLHKWIIVILYYQVAWVFRILGWFLPAIPALRICLGFWIMLPQFRGEFFLWHALESYIKKCEQTLMGYRCVLSSYTVRFFTLVHQGALQFCVPYISEECVVKTQTAAEECLDMLREEMEVRVDRGGIPEEAFDDMVEMRQPVGQQLDNAKLDEIRQDPRRQPRDSYIVGNQSHARLNLNKTQNLGEQRKRTTFSPPEEDPRMSSGIPDPLLNESLYSGSHHQRAETMQDPAFREQLWAEEERMKVLLRQRMLREREIAQRQNQMNMSMHGPAAYADVQLGTYEASEEDEDYYERNRRHDTMTGTEHMRINPNHLADIKQPQSTRNANVQQVNIGGAKLSKTQSAAQGNASALKVPKTGDTAGKTGGAKPSPRGTATTNAAASARTATKPAGTKSAASRK